MSELCLSADLQTLTVLTIHNEQQTLMTVDTSRLWEQRAELSHVTQQFEQISSLLEYLGKAVEHMEAQVFHNMIPHTCVLRLEFFVQWHDGVKQLNTKMDALKALLKDYGRDTTPEVT